MNCLLVDLFAGGGGASVGIEAALGRYVDLAINHDPLAIAVHQANHPHTRHLESNVWEVDPRKATGGRPVDLLWASPDCTHFSRAKGGKPRDHGNRSLAWVVVNWARDVQPRVICLENVREFATWGPLTPAGQPDPDQAGLHYDEWTEALRRLGYAVDSRVLDASQYGAPTRRLRLFVVARRDGEPIRWPAPTHGEPLSGRRRKDPRAAELAWEQACRAQWRALALVIKAKLEAVESGISTLEEEFLAWVTLPNGASIGQALLPQLRRISESGSIPHLLSTGPVRGEASLREVKSTG